MSELGLFDFKEEKVLTLEEEEEILSGLKFTAKHYYDNNLKKLLEHFEKSILNPDFPESLKKAENKKKEREKIQINILILKKHLEKGEEQ